MTHDHPSPSEVAERLAAKMRETVEVSRTDIMGNPYTTSVMRNPDGEAAAQALLSQAGEIERLRGALTDIAEGAEAEVRIAAAGTMQLHMWSSVAKRARSALQGDGG